MRVVFTETAKSDLFEIARFIARDSPTRARTFARELRATARSLGDRPLAFPLLDRFAQLGVRRRVHGNYLIFYRIDDATVVILRILHGARDYETLLGGGSNGRRAEEKTLMT